MKRTRDAIIDCMILLSFREEITAYPEREALNWTVALRLSVV